MNNDYKLIKNTEWKEVEVNGDIKEIPINWSVEKIGKNIQFNRGGTPIKTGDNYSGDLPWITISNLTEKYISNYTAKIKRDKNTKIFKKGTLLGSFKMSVGRFAFATEDCSTNEGIMGFNINENLHNANYLYYTFPNPFIQNALPNQQGVLLLNTDIIKNIEFLLPNLHNQNMIAEILSAQESIIQDIELLISKYESRFQYLSEELLSGRLRVKEVDGQTILYKNSEDNWKEVEVNGEVKDIPCEWVVETIEKTIPLNMGNTPKKESDSYNGDLPWITISNLTEKYITNYTAKIKKNKNIRLFPKGTLLISFKMSVGKCGFTTEYSAINEAIMGIQQKDTNDNLKYLYYSLPTIFSNNAMPNGQGLLLLNQEKIKSLNYIQPNFAEQLLLAKTLEKQEDLIEAQKEFLNKEKQKFNWLLDNLLSGHYLIKEV